MTDTQSKSPSSDEGAASLRKGMLTVRVKFGIVTSVCGVLVSGACGWAWHAQQKIDAAEAHVALVDQKLDQIAAEVKETKQDVRELYNHFLPPRIAGLTP